MQQHLGNEVETIVEDATSSDLVTVVLPLPGLLLVAEETAMGMANKVVDMAVPLLALPVALHLGISKALPRHQVVLQPTGAMQATLEGVMEKLAVLIRLNPVWVLLPALVVPRAA